jgi:hypothetical protein
MDFPDWLAPSEQKVSMIMISSTRITSSDSLAFLTLFFFFSTRVCAMEKTVKKIPGFL